MLPSPPNTANRINTTTMPAAAEATADQRQQPEQQSASATPAETAAAAASPRFANIDVVGVEIVEPHARSPACAVAPPCGATAIVARTRRTAHGAAEGERMFLKGKTAVITGSTSGIGLACARALAAEGAAVVVNGFGDAAAIEAIRAELAATSGTTALYDPADMTKPDEIAALVARAVAEAGGCDIVVNNAGIQHVAGIADFPVDHYDRIIAINMSSAWHMMRARRCLTCAARGGDGSSRLRRRIR